jgi:type IV pilus assembly protein PilY1
MRPVRSMFRLRTLALGTAAVLGFAARASAQTEAQKPAPNVLLLVDTSGSMEYKTDGTLPKCTPGNTDPTQSEKSRWINLVEVLTGTFNNYSCWSEDRSSGAFSSEFTLGGSVAPYDYGYSMPYNRALSNGCAYGAGVAPSSSAPYSWPNNAVTTFPYSSTTQSLTRTVFTGCTSPAFSQNPDGLLDIYRNDIRFGLMTFDSRVSSGTGLTGTGPAATANNASGMDGNWSYYLGSPVTGHPANCSIATDQEVGARNAAAPPWEGRMIAFGAPSLAPSDLAQRNSQIQQVLLSTRPYGATPIAGQVADAKAFLWSDTSTDPLDTTQKFGPSTDPNWLASNCRKTIMIILTDGEPNLDLRPYCDQEVVAPATAGVCPYDKPEDTVKALQTAASLSVETYVIGFAISHVTPYNGTSISCADLTDAQCADPNNNNTNINTDSKNIQACCTLNKIAAAGGTDATTHAPRKAYYADDSTQLKAIFTDILGNVIRTATRTSPVFSSPGGDASSRGFKFYSAFNPRPDPLSTQLWSGILNRVRYQCDTVTHVAQAQPLSTSKGDDFASNVNLHGGDRWFYTVVGTGDNLNSIRPGVSVNNDGLGTSTGTQKFANQPSSLAGLIPAATMAITSGNFSTTCPGASDANTGGTRVVQELVGITDSAGYTRCPASTGCNLLGGIYHSTPTIVPGRPSEQLRDDSYAVYTQSMGNDARPTVLYTSTIDGFLHAFNVAPYPGSAQADANQIITNANNELWSFIPPAVLPVLKVEYPNTHAILLDGVPIIKDVVSKADGSAFERTRTEAQVGGGTWHTALVQGFGDSSQAGGGYFALDVTRPARTSSVSPTPQPNFLWQLTRNTSGTALFGNGGTPLITTVYLNSVSGPREVPVAVLPGGDAANVSGTAPTVGPVSTIDPAYSSTYPLTRKGRLYDATALAARSLTFVRLDTGEVVRTFRPSASSALFSSSVFAATDIEAPIVGQPKAFPETTGAVADRIFVGDRDGRLWRVDVSATDPTQWTMSIFFDAFYDQSDPTQRQPVVLPPVVSVNTQGQTTVAFATGDQQATSASATMVNRVVSLTEELDATNGFEAKPNWVHTLTTGERVTGPMVLFNEGLYYAASRPPSSSSAACDVGSSKVYGTNYINSLTLGNPSTGPGYAPNQTSLVLSSRSDGLTFGLSLQAEPTCTNDATTISGNDSFGYGTVSMSTIAKPGRYLLTFEVTGSNSGSDGVLEVQQELTRPSVPVTFQSWAPIYGD